MAEMILKKNLGFLRIGLDIQRSNAETARLESRPDEVAFVEAGRCRKPGTRCACSSGSMFFVEDRPQDGQLQGSALKVGKVPPLGWGDGSLA